MSSWVYAYHSRNRKSTPNPKFFHKTITDRGLTPNYFYDTLPTMNSKRIKTLIKQLIKQYGGSLEGLASDLKISVRYLEMLRDGEKKAGFHLAAYARQLLKK